MPRNAPSAVQDRSHGPAQLPPGSELDARVATALGWRRNGTALHPWKWTDLHGKSGPLPAYSTNPKDALNLFDSLMHRRSFCVTKHDDGSTSIRSGCHTASAETFQHALSLLALQLLEKEALQ